MRKTPEDFYNLYTTEFRPLFLSFYCDLGEDYENYKDRISAFAWVAFMLSFVETCSKVLPMRGFNSLTLEGVLKNCDAKTTERLFDAMRSNILGACRIDILSAWLREMFSLRFDLDNSELNVFFEAALKEMELKR